MNAQVGETVTLAVNIKGGDPVTFEIKLEDQVIATVAGTTKDGTSTGSWKVDVGAHALPVDVTFTAQAKGKAVSSGTLTVDPAPPVIGPIGPSGPVKNAVMVNGILVLDVGTSLPMTTTIHTREPVDLEVFVDDVPVGGAGQPGKPLGPAIFTQAGVSGGAPAEVTIPWDVKPVGTALVQLRCDVKQGGAVIEQRRSNLVVLTDWVDVTLKDAPGTAAQGAEGRERHVFLSGQPVPEVADGATPGPPVTAQRLPAWSHTAVTVELDGQVPAQGALVPDEQGHVRARWAHGAKVSTVAVRAEQTLFAAAWHDAGATAAAEIHHHVVQPRTAVDFPITARRRLSLWLSPNLMFGWPGETEKPWPLDADGGSRWAAMRDHVDDVVLLGVFTPVLAASGATVRYPGTTDQREVKLAAMRRFLAKAHDHAIQVLVGHGGIINSVADSPWLSFLNDAKTVTDAQLTAMAKQICQQIFDADGLAFDGLDFDLEHLTAKSVWPMRLRQRVRSFFRALAVELQVRKKLLGIASASFVSHADVAPNTPATGSGSGQTFTLAIECPNILLRPMCYDNAFLDGALLDFQRQVVAFALADAPGGAGLHPAQFQIGVKTFKGTNNSELPFIPGDQATNNHRLKGWYRTMPGDLITICKDTLAPSRVGVICFGPPFGSLAEIDAALNPRAGEKKRLNGIGTPLQAPLLR
jgi:hypothetical protein